MPAPNKEKIRLLFLAELEAQLEDLKNAVAVAKDAATHDEAKSEGKYDTRAIESGYMAGAQEVRMKELEGRVGLCRALRLKPFPSDSTVSNGALVRVETDKGVERYYLVLKHLGGSSVNCDGVDVRVISEVSNAGRAFIGLYAEEEYAFGDNCGVVREVI
jgi:hypothetical protein